MKKYRDQYNARFVEAYIWKIQNPGGWNHFSFSLPTQDFSDPVPGDSDRYHFNMFYEYVWNTTESYGFKMLDMPSPHYRPDKHVGGTDCLHFCLPGPVDLFSALM